MYVDVFYAITLDVFYAIMFFARRPCMLMYMLNTDALLVTIFAGIAIAVILLFASSIVVTGALLLR